MEPKYIFINPNSYEQTVGALLKMFVEVNLEKVQDIIENSVSTSLITDTAG